MDPVEDAKQGMGSVERAITGLPGIQGYREKEMRRDADKQVRMLLSQRLLDQRQRLTEQQNQLLSAGGLLWMDDVERLVSKVTTLADRIRTASYGYAGFFDLQRVKEAELDRLIAFDQALADGMGPLADAVTALGTAIGANEGIKEAIQAIADQLSKINDIFGQRAEAMHAAA